MPADLAALVLEAPADDAGGPVGDPDGGWRVVVQVLLPSNARSVVGAFRVGVDPIAADVWTDMADYVTGWRIRGGSSDFGDHHDPVTLEVTFDSPGRMLAPWGPIGATGSGHRFQAGCPIRVVLFNPDLEVWVPLFTGEIETAVHTSIGNGTVHTLAVTAVDTVHSRLSKVDLLDYIADPDATAMDMVDVVAELVDLAGFPYGSIVDIQIDDDGNPYQIAGAVGLSGNLLETLRRMADSLGRKVGCDRYGRLLFVRRRPDLVAYSNAYTPSTDPNAPDPVTLDTASFPDGVSVVPAKDAVVNAFDAQDLVEQGLFSPATIGDDAVAVRVGVVADATVGRGLQSSTSNSVIDAGLLFRWNEVDVSDPASIDRFGLNRRSIGQVFPNGYSFFVMGRIGGRLLELQADGRQLFRATGVRVDDVDDMALIADLQVGAAATVTHDGATLEGFVSDITYAWSPLGDGSRLDVEVAVDCYSVVRGTL